MEKLLLVKYKILNSILLPAKIHFCIIIFIAFGSLSLAPAQSFAGPLLMTNGLPVNPSVYGTDSDIGSNNISTNKTDVVINRMLDPIETEMSVNFAGQGVVIDFTASTQFPAPDMSKGNAGQGYDLIVMLDVYAFTGSRVERLHYRSVNGNAASSFHSEPVDTEVNYITQNQVSYSPAAIVPEPISSTLFMVGVILMAGRRYRQKHNRNKH